MCMCMCVCVSFVSKVAHFSTLACAKVLIQVTFLLLLWLLMLLLSFGTLTHSPFETRCVRVCVEESSHKPWHTGRQPSTLQTAEHDELTKCNSNILQALLPLSSTPSHFTAPLIHLARHCNLPVECVCTARSAVCQKFVCIIMCKFSSFSMPADFN